MNEKIEQGIPCKHCKTIPHYIQWCNGGGEAYYTMKIMDIFGAIINYIGQIFMKNLILIGNRLEI